ncbi:MAG: ArsI/CadI family heavy metal resistance metalloenzyme [Amphiplicatus sp.]
MKRLHVHIRAKDLDESVRFYSALFGRGPDKHEPDYAKWLLDDPRANISISTRADAAGVDHVGVQVDDRDALLVIADRLKATEADLVEQTDATCCYARSDKYWARSPEGAVWELFHTFGDSADYGGDLVPQTAGQVGACCPETGCAEAATAPEAACCAPQ